MDTMYTELSLAAAGFVLGIFLMAVYDVLRLFRFLVSHTPLWTGLEDVVYWLGFRHFLLCASECKKRGRGENLHYCFCAHRNAFMGQNLQPDSACPIEKSEEIF